MDPSELQAYSLPTNNFQNPNIHHNRQTIWTPAGTGHNGHKQKGSKRTEMDVMEDQLMISNAISENCWKRRKTLATAWISYKKAIESVPQSWTIKCTNLYKVHPMITRWTESSMSRLKTNVTLVHSQGVLVIGPISTKRGKFHKPIKHRTPKDCIWLYAGWKDQGLLPVLCWWP